RLYPNERGTDFIDGEVKIIKGDFAQSPGKALFGQGQEVLPERAAAADLVFPEPGLRLVDSQRTGRAERRPEPVSIQALVVNAVSGLVEGAEESIVETIRVVARGQASVAWPEAAAKWVCGHIETPGSKIEADGCGRLLSEFLLTVDWIVAFQDFASRL